MSDAVIMLLCQKYGISETWLRTGAGPMRPALSREEELGSLVNSLMADSPNSFRTALITALLRFDPDRPEWAVLERIYAGIAAEAARLSTPDPPAGKD